MEALANLLPFALILALMYVLLIRPARKQQQKVSATQSRVALGARVRTGSGIYATVVGIDDANVDLEIAPGVVVTFLRAAVTHVLETGAETSPDSGDTDVVDADEDFADDDTDTGPEIENEGYGGSSDSAGAGDDPRVDEASADHVDDTGEPGPTSTDSPNADRPAV